ncbi:MAG: O-succinylbenzoic acid--CoA ligase, partial [Flavobacteriales bacterium]|nr:O-succinylbenzoic acid--CoA ligase [Flavobacteriales bacterium]
AMVLGWNVEVIPPCSCFLDILKKNVDFSAVVPLQMYQDLSSLKKVKKILVGGGDVSSSFLKKLEKENITTRIFQSYAMTETITHVAIRELYPCFEEQYTALTGISFDITDNQTLKIHAPLICENDVITTDLVELLDQRHFIWKGRADNVINSGGVKIHPEQTEKVLSEILEGRFFVTSTPDEILGEKQVLLIEGEEKDFPQLGAFLTEKFDSIHRPKEVFFLKKFALTHTGKIDRKKTKGLY